MKRIFLAASLLVAAVFAGALMGRAHRPQPRPAHGKAPFQRPGSMNWRQPRSCAPGGAAILRFALSRHEKRNAYVLAHPLPSVTDQQRLLSHDLKEWYAMRPV